MEKYLQECEFIDYFNKDLQKLAHDLAKNCDEEEQIVKNCFLFVRDEIKHLGDNPRDIKTCKASDVLKHKIGWCYSKSHLLAALLRANNIPTALCYQKLSCSEYKDDIYCLHGLNAVYLKKYGWYRLDVRGNKEGVDAQFCPPKERLAFSLGKNEHDIEGLFAKPLDRVVKYLNKYEKYEDMINNFPDE